MISVGQLCDNVDNVVVAITHIGAPSGDDLVKVEDVLNDLAVTGSDGDVIVVGWPSCGCRTELTHESAANSNHT